MGWAQNKNRFFKKRTFGNQKYIPKVIAFYKEWNSKNRHGNITCKSLAFNCPLCKTDTAITHSNEDIINMNGSIQKKCPSCFKKVNIYKPI